MPIKSNTSYTTGIIDLTYRDPRTKWQREADEKLGHINSATSFEDIKLARHRLVKYLDDHKQYFKSSHHRRRKAVIQLAESKVDKRPLKTQLSDTTEIYRNSLEKRPEDTVDFKRRQHVLKTYLQTMQLGITGKPFDPEKSFDYNQLTIAQAAAMNLRLHLEFDSQEALQAYQNYLVGGNFKEEIDYQGTESALKKGKLVYPRTSTHALKPGKNGEPAKEIKSQLAGIIGWLKASWHYLTNGKYDRNRPTGNKGINLRIRGKSNLNFSGKTVGSIDGMDGTLLTNTTLDEKKGFFALSLSVEDSAPGQKNQFGKVHSNLGDTSIFSATGFTKKAPKNLKFFDKALLFFKNPWAYFKGKHTTELNNKNDEWNSIKIIPPEKRSGFSVNRKITLADVLKLQSTEFKLAFLDKPIEDNLIAVEQSAATASVFTGYDTDEMSNSEPSLKHDPVADISSDSYIKITLATAENPNSIKPITVTMTAIVPLATNDEDTNDSAITPEEEQASYEDDTRFTNANTTRKL